MISFDSLILKAFVEENKEFIQGARINKIQQPTRRELILALRNKAHTKQFYVNITPEMYHVCFMSKNNEQKRNIEIPQKPPMFCMLLRKYLNNSQIAKIEQPDGERILELYIETYNEIGDKIYLCLAIELMGKYSNIILYNTDTNIILGCAHNVGSDKSQVREVYGQIPYTYPPEHASKMFIKERYSFLHSYQQEIFKTKNVNSLIDNFYTYHISKNKFKILKSEYTTLTNKKLRKCTKSIEEMEKQYKKSKNYDKYRLYGDLLMANFYNLNDYIHQAEVFDYENNQDIIILLNSSKTIKENANEYYKKYNKDKRAGIKLNELIEEYKKNKKYLESILYSIEIAENIEDLKEIETEIRFPDTGKKEILCFSQNNIPPHNHSNDKSQILFIDKSDGGRIYIGKNNKQNDYIISKLANDEDLWFHTKDCPGSHVLLKTQNITDELILECARLAKDNSQGKNSSKIGVIYTKCKYLRKPPKANLGYVTYKNEKEIVID